MKKAFTLIEGLICVAIIAIIVGIFVNVCFNRTNTNNIILDPNIKLINVIVSSSDLWYLTRPMRENEFAETYVLKQDPIEKIFQIFGTEYIFKETKTKAEKE